MRSVNEDNKYFDPSNIFSFGDNVEIIGSDGSYGVVVEVDNRDNEVLNKVIFDNGKTDYFRNDELEPQSSRAASGDKFVFGDKVVVNFGHRKGSVGVVVTVDSDGQNKVRFPDGYCEYYTSFGLIRYKDTLSSSQVTERFVGQCDCENSDCNHVPVDCPEKATSPKGMYGLSYCNACYSKLPSEYKKNESVAFASLADALICEKIMESSPDFKIGDRVYLKKTSRLFGAKRNPDSEDILGTVMLVYYFGIIDVRWDPGYVSSCAEEDLVKFTGDEKDGV